MLGLNKTKKQPDKNDLTSRLNELEEKRANSRTERAKLTTEIATIEAHKDYRSDIYGILHDETRKKRDAITALSSKEIDLDSDVTKLKQELRDIEKVEKIAAYKASVEDSEKRFSKAQRKRSEIDKYVSDLRAKRDNAVRVLGELRAKKGELDTAQLEQERDAVLSDADMPTESQALVAAKKEIETQERKLAILNREVDSHQQLFEAVKSEEQKALSDCYERKRFELMDADSELDKAFRTEVSRYSTAKRKLLTQWDDLRAEKRKSGDSYRDCDNPIHSVPSRRFQLGRVLHESVIEFGTNLRAVVDIPPVSGE